MSVEAITWALKQPVPKSSTKFVLVVLANCASAANNLAYPSVQYIVEATGQDRKTVISSLRRLADLGLIEDTKERRGKTRQVIVYRLRVDRANGGDLVTQWHYVYRCTDPASGRFYVGVRSCYGDPANDSGYTGSGVWPNSCALHGVVLHKDILAVFPTRAAAEEAERGAIASADGDSRCMNRAERKDAKNGLVCEQAQKRACSGGKRVPKTTAKSTEKSAQQSPKRDTEPLLTVIETKQGPVKKLTSSQERRTAEARGMKDVRALLQGLEA